MRRATAVLAAAGMVGVATLSGASGLVVHSASAGDPVLSLTASAQYVVGSTVERYPYYMEGVYSTAQMNVTWSAPGACGVVVERGYDGIDPEEILRAGWTVVAFTGVENDYDGDWGGGAGQSHGYMIRAYDCSTGAVAAEKWVETSPYVVQENGLNYGNNQSTHGVTLAYSGKWSMSTCACAVAGQQRYTTAKKASVAIKRTYRAGDSVALVMAKGPKRGVAKVMLDGKKVAKIDTYAAANLNRQVVWARVMTAGTHTVTVVNLATKGHPRIDFDAVVTN